MEAKQVDWTLPNGSSIEPGKVYEFDGNMQVVSVSDLSPKVNQETNEIVERYYDVIASNNEHTIRSFGVSSRSLSRVANKFRREGYRVNWEETQTYIRRHGELQEITINPVAETEIFPDPSFQCPSEHAEPDMNYERAHAKVARSTYTPPTVKIVEPDYADPRSKLHDMYLADIAKNGLFEITDKITKELAYRGNRSGAAKFLTESNRPLNHFDYRRLV